jgi:hypothetical protein
MMAVVALAKQVSVVVEVEEEGGNNPEIEWMDHEVSMGK